MMEYRASPAEEGHAVEAHRFALAPLVRFIDASVAHLQRLRNRIEAPAEEEESGGRRRNPARVAESPVAPAAAAPKSPRLRHVLFVALALVSGILLGVAFSYRLLSHAIDTNEATANTLRDEIVRFEKNEIRLQDDKARYLKQLNETDKEIRALQSAIEDYRGEIEELRGQIGATKGVRSPTAAGDAAARRPAPQKTGTCITGGANAAADLARCVDEFNRK